MTRGIFGWRWSGVVFPGRLVSEDAGADQSATGAVAGWKPATTSMCGLQWEYNHGWYGAGPQAVGDEEGDELPFGNSSTLRLPVVPLHSRPILWRLMGHLQDLVESGG